MDDDRRDELNRVSFETIRFLRANYLLDEVGDGKGTLRFQQKGETFFSIQLQKDWFDFIFELNVEACERLRNAKEGFSPAVQRAFASSDAKGDVVTLCVSVADADRLEEVKRLLLLLKAPDRPSLRRENALRSPCGMRCDLCVHFTGDSARTAEQQADLQRRTGALYGADDYGEDMMRCPGCVNKPEAPDCPAAQCFGKRGEGDCLGCAEAPCDKMVLPRAGIDPKRELSAEDITFAVLPYVFKQYQDE